MTQPDITPVRPASMVALLTDFGVQDPYLGQMKGQLARLMPGLTPIDLCHAVRPHDVEQAGLFLSASYQYFPEGTLFLSIVDPGVGTSRKILLARHRRRLFMAPDNGLLTLAFDQAPEELWDITPEESDHRKASTTFHGRDIFVPLAVRLLKGETPDTIGTPASWAGCIHPVVTRPILDNAVLTARVVHVDHFGNLITNMKIDEWQPFLASCSALWVETTEGSCPLKLVETYSELSSDEAGILPGSQGRLEIAVNEDSAARLLQIRTGQRVRVLLDQPAA